MSIGCYSERRSVTLMLILQKLPPVRLIVPIARVTNLATFIDRIKGQNLVTYGLIVENYQNVDYQGSIALIIGNEAKVW